MSVSLADCSHLLHPAVFFFQAEDGIRDDLVTGVQTCALPIFRAITVVVPIPAGESEEEETLVVRSVQATVRAAPGEKSGRRPPGVVRVAALPPARIRQRDEAVLVLVPEREAPAGFRRPAEKRGGEDAPAVLVPEREAPARAAAVLIPAGAGESAERVEAPAVVIRAVDPERIERVVVRTVPVDGEDGLIALSREMTLAPEDGEDAIVLVLDGRLRDRPEEVELVVRARHTVLPVLRVERTDREEVVGEREERPGDGSDGIAPVGDRPEIDPVPRLAVVPHLRALVKRRRLHLLR